MTYLRDRERLLAGETSCVEITEKFLSVAAENKNNAYVNVFADSARNQALQADNHLKENNAGRLAGMVISIKDLIAIEGQPVSAGSGILQEYTSPFHATAVERLVEEGAIIIGSTNCDEFGMGSSNENSYYGPVKNDQNTERVPGGSSGGAAVSVQEGSCHVALGTDTGGSVRQPASFCGIYGLKPTYSKISRFGLLAYASSFDTIGMLAKTTEEIQMVLEVIEGWDQKDSTSSGSDTRPAENEFRNFAYFKQALESDGLQEEIRDKFVSLIAALERDGYEVTEIDFPLSEYLLETYYILTTAEASSNLSRYDGMRYGTPRSAGTSDLSLTEAYKTVRSEGFGDEVKRRIFLGTFVLSANYYDAYYTKAQKARQLIRKETLEILSKHSLILSPVAPTTAFKIGELVEDPLEMYLSDLYTVHASVCGLPAISIPFGTDSDDLPFGLQATANDFEEEKLFQFSNYLANLTL